MTLVESLRHEVETLFSQHFSANDHFILAISGGIDSMVLLDILVDLFPERCTVVTIDHHLRSTSKDDTNLVKEFCTSHQVECLIENIDTLQLTKNGNAVEEVARHERYRILENIRKQKNAAAIVTAHHAQDQIETLIMHLLRGSNLQGLIGMQVLNKSKIFRPLLSHPKAQLKTYAQAQMLKWHDDETNHDTRYLRNHVRLHWSSVLEPTLQPISHPAQLLQSEIDDLISQWEHQHGIPQKPFTREVFYQLTFYLRLAWIHKLLVNYFQLEDVTALWVGNVYHWLENTKQGSHYQHKDKNLLTYRDKHFLVTH